MKGECVMLLNFDFSSNIPLYIQLRNQVVIGIAEGKLLPGDRLPTIRTLADESGINMMTVSKAYQLLKQEGYITTDRRSGAVISPRQTEPSIPKEVIEALRLHISELRLAGMNQKDVLNLCRKLYEEGLK
jgi:DNA-binding transcriptional regulator YhcF (GntR family)